MIFRTKNRMQPGFSLTELLIALSLIAVIAIFATPLVLNNSKSVNANARQKNAISNVQNTIQLASGNIGLFPLNYGPGKILTADRLKATASATPLSSVPQKCQVTKNGRPVVVANNKAIKLREKITVYGANDSWTAGEGRNGKAGDWVCFFDENDPQGEVSIELLERESTSSGLVASSASTQSATASGSVAQNSSSVTTSLPSSTIPVGNTPQVQTEKANITVQTNGPGPLDGVTVTAILNGDAAHPITQVTAGGQTVFTNIEKGTVIYLTVYKPLFVSPAAQGFVVSRDQTAVFTLLPPSNITVQVNGPGPLDGATVTAILNGDTAHPQTYITSGGRVVFPNIPRGTYMHITAIKDRFSVPAPQGVTVNGDQTVVFTLIPNVNVPVYVSNAYRGYLHGATVNGSGYYAVTNGGLAILENVPPGTYMGVWVSLPGYDTKLVYFTASSSPVFVTLDATPIEVILFSANTQTGSFSINQLFAGWLNGYYQYKSKYDQAMIARDNALLVTIPAIMNAIYANAAVGQWGNVAALQAQYNQTIVWATQLLADAAYYASVANELLYNHYYGIMNAMGSLFGGNAANAAAQVVSGNNIPVFFDRNGNVIVGNANTLGRMADGTYVSGDGTRYRVVGSFATPIKISLKGTIAKLDSNDDYLFDYDGFAKNKLPMVKPAGGLNPDEAWLVVDRHRNGIVNSLGIIDGDDVFGDHVHKVANGYLDMGQVFQKSLKRDSEGKLYFEVKKLPWWEEWFVIIARFFGYMKDPIAGMDLKLLDRKKHIVPAHKYLKKVYVDYWTVDEWDAKEENWIGQRAKVQFVDGHWSESADQWFKIGWRLMPLPPDKNSKPPLAAPAKTSH